jgi:hypothetical protein
LSPEDALFVTRRQKNGKNRDRGRSNLKENSSENRGKGSKSKDRSGSIKCYGCGIKGHKLSECKHPEKWQAHQKSNGKDSANMAMDSKPSQNSVKPEQLFETSFG